MVSHLLCSLMQISERMGHGCVRRRTPLQWKCRTVGEKGQGKIYYNAAKRRHSNRSLPIVAFPPPPCSTPRARIGRMFVASPR